MREVRTRNGVCHVPVGPLFISQSPYTLNESFLASYHTDLPPDHVEY